MKFFKMKKWAIQKIRKVNTKWKEKKEIKMIKSLRETKSTIELSDIIYS